MKCNYKKLIISTFCATISIALSSNAVNDVGEKVGGAWNSWTPWSKCSATCESSDERRRQRECNSPSPSGGGANCPGRGSEVLPCNVNECPDPADPTWGEWEAWSKCTQTCGGGEIRRTRECKPASETCVGKADDVLACLAVKCTDPTWGEWEAWSQCTQTCGGEMRRTRTCKPASETCEGKADDVLACPAQKCTDETHGAWSSWTNWTTCADVCNANQTKSRTRKCNLTNMCVGIAEEFLPCEFRECPLNGTWSLWSNFTECTTSCESGKMHRYRNCSSSFVCPGESKEIVACNKKRFCPISAHRYQVIKIWSIVMCVLMAVSFVLLFLGSLRYYNARPAWELGYEPTPFFREIHIKT